MSAPAQLAAAGPVIPHYGGHSSQCVVHNHFFCWDWVEGNWSSVLWPALRQHVYLAVVAVSIGFVISIALALLARRWRWTEQPTILITTFLYTIPSLALFELLVAPVGANILTGLRDVPPDVLDAAEGMGMTRTQQLLRIEFPLALPGIIAGLRIAVVTTIALATIVYTIYDAGLGVPIHSALGEGPFKTELIAAAVLTIGLAIFADGMLVLIQRALTPWARTRRAA